MQRLAIASSFTFAVAVAAACADDFATDPAALPASTEADASVADSANAAEAPAVADAGVDVARMRVFFVGNSQTFVNDLPSVVRPLGDATPSAAVEVDQAVQGGARFLDHWTNAITMGRIANGNWDAVVLQGQSVEPIHGDTFYPYAGLLAGAVTDAGARTVWFATWARRPDHPIYDELTFDGGPLTPETMTSGVEGAYQSAAKDFGGIVARVGAAWQIALAEQPSIALFHDDGSHPSPAGTLLTACVILRAMTGVAPKLPTPPPLGLARADASALCAIAERL